MAFDMSGIFAQQQISGQNPNIWPGLQQYTTGPLGNLMLGNSVFNGHPNLLSQQMMPPPPVDIPKADAIQGIGELTWLSAKAGLITCKDQMVISFQLKDFCDQMLNDLTSVLRVGFTLSFHAALNETNEYTATLVQPVYGPEAEAVFANSREVDLEKAYPTPPNSKDAYSPQIEARAIPALLAIFQRHGLQQIQLSSLHSQMSNCGDEELFRYVGTSSLKRRQFVERRTHIFRLQNDDTIVLQSPAVYLCVFRLASYLLRRGGATAIQSLYDYFMSSDIQQEVRDQTGDTRQEFLNLISAHNWVFALFPNRTYVSVRRNLPRYDYPGFVKQHFPELDVLRPVAPRVMTGNSYGQPRAITRTMSAHQSMVGGFNVSNANNTRSSTSSILVDPRTRPQSLWDTQAPVPQVQAAGTGPNEQWSPMFSPTAWTNRGNLLSALGGGDLLSGVPVGGLSSILGLGNKQMVSRSVQTESRSDNAIGRPGCTCGCVCGRANVNSAGVIGVNGRGSSSRASGGSASPPSIDSNSPASYERFSPSAGIGSIGDRLNSQIAAPDVSAAPSTTAAAGTNTTTDAAPRYYDPFGTADLLNGSRMSSLRIN